MRNMEDAVLIYIDAIKASEEYQKYVSVKERVKQYPELKSQIDEYRRRNFELQTSEHTAFEEMEQFEREYAGFRENPLVADYLAAELDFCRMMQGINIRVTQAIDFDGPLC